MTSKQLFEGPVSHAPWSEQEVKALVEFILFHTPGDNWPTTKNDHFWRNAAMFVKERSCANVLRTSKVVLHVHCIHIHGCCVLYIHVHSLFCFPSLDSACRYKVLIWLKKKFPTPLDAERELFHPRPTPERRERCDVAVQTDLLPGVAPTSSSQCVPSSRQSLHDAIEQLPVEERMHAISVQFARIAESEHGVCVPSDFFAKSSICNVSTSEKQTFQCPL